MDKKIKVVIVEDHKIVREGLRLLLEKEPDIEVIGEAEDGKEAVKLAEELKPDCIIMDLLLPNLNGVEATELIREKDKDVKIVILSMYDNEEYFITAVRAGINGYILKGSGISDLVRAVKTVVKGNAYFSPEVSKYLLKLSKKGLKEVDGLTQRELEVLKLVCEGYTSQQIALKLGISVKTVETHRSNIMNKLGVFSIAELVRYAIKKGLIIP